MPKRMAVSAWVVILVVTLTGCQIAAPPSAMPPIPVAPAAMTQQPASSQTGVPASASSAVPSALQIDPADVRAIRIEYQWDGLSRVAPVSRTYELRRSDAAFVGPATFVVAARAEQPSRDQFSVSVPQDVVARYLTTLDGATLADKPYEPPRALDNYPHVAMTLETSRGVVVVYSESVAQGYAPWAATIPGAVGKTFVIDSDVPNRALEVLKPYLREDVLQRLIQEVQAQP